MNQPREETQLWRTRFEPLADITAYELAMDMKHVNASQIVASYSCVELGSALRHRILEERSRTPQRMDVVWAEFLAARNAASTPPPASPAPRRRDDWHYDSQGYCDNPGRGY